MSDRPWPPRGDASYKREVVETVGADLAHTLADVELMIFDADGVLTPGNLIYGPKGEALKEFHAHDGLGLVMARVAGIKRAVLTGRNSVIVGRRAEELRFDAIELGRFDKEAALAEILAATGVTPRRTLYMGDDLIDLPVLDRVGVPVAVPAAPGEVKERCVYVTAAAGGQGAVREMTDLVLKAAGKYGPALARLADEAWRPTPAELSSDETGEPPSGGKTQGDDA